MDREDKKIEGESAPEPSTKLPSPKKKTKELLKARSKIAKSVAKNFLKTKKASNSPFINATECKEKGGMISECCKENNDESGKNANPVNENKQKVSTGKDHTESRLQINNNQENIVPSGNNQENIGPSGNKLENIGVSDHSREQQKQEEKPGTSVMDQKKNKKLAPHRKRQRNKNKQMVNPPKNNEKPEEKEVVKEGKQKDDKPGKLGGLIFMCSGKTKPDCFHYRVMGTLSGKKDLILGVKPGLKLFLYDFDLKLMYGVYKASSSGGVKLEPKAFGGAFPAQVRFKIDADCYPLPESVFKKAIKENYNEKQKFKTELTTRQVSKLVKLFRPVTLHSKALPVPSPPRARVRIIEPSENKGRYHEARELMPHSDRETSTRDPYSDGRAVGYTALPHERDYQLAHEGRGSRGIGENPPDLYLSEKDYRTFGLRGERRNLVSQSHIAPTLSPCQHDYDREQLLGQRDPLYKESVPTEREVIHADPHYMIQRNYNDYNFGGGRALPAMRPAANASMNATVVAAADAYAVNRGYRYHYGASSTDPYYPAPRGEIYLVDDLSRREGYLVDRSYSAYGTNAPSQYSRAHHVQIVDNRAGAAPVSSRYSFDGPSLSYR